MGAVKAGSQYYFLPNNNFGFVYLDLFVACHEARGVPHEHCWSPAHSHCGPVPLKCTSPKSLFPLFASAVQQEHHHWEKKGKERVYFIQQCFTDSTGMTLPH